MIDGSGRFVVFFCRGWAGLPVGGVQWALCQRNLDDGSVRVVRRGLSTPLFHPQIVTLSRDGNWVAAASNGPILTTGAPNPNRFWQLYLVEVSTGFIELVSAAPDGVPGDRSSGEPFFYSLSDDGDFVAFLTGANNLGGGIPPGPKIVVKQRSTGVIKLASSIHSFGAGAPTLSGDGLRLAYLDYLFLFNGSNAVGRVYDWQTNSNRGIDGPPGGNPDDLQCGTFFFGFMGSLDIQQRLALSGDGRTVVFASFATNLFPGDEPNTCDLFVRSLAPVPQPALPPQPVPGPEPALLVLLMALLAGIGGVTLARRGSQPTR